MVALVKNYELEDEIDTGRIGRPIVILRHEEGKGSFLQVSFELFVMTIQRKVVSSEDLEPFWTMLKGRMSHEEAHHFISLTEKAVQEILARPVELVIKTPKPSRAN